jgi:hypothetical protein
MAWKNTNMSLHMELGLLGSPDYKDVAPMALINRPGVNNPHECGSAFGFLPAFKYVVFSPGRKPECVFFDSVHAA